jgi:hypothetical protein
MKKPCVKCGSVVEDKDFTLCDTCLFDVVVMGETEKPKGAVKEDSIPFDDLHPQRPQAYGGFAGQGIWGR